VASEKAVELSVDSAKALLEAALDKAGASKQLKDVALFVVENAVLYTQFCAKQRRKPDDVASLFAFLKEKGKSTLKLSVDDLACAIALYDFAEGLWKRKSLWKGGPIPATIVASLTLLDALGAANSCTFIQEAFYHAFLKSCTVQIVPVTKRSSTEADPSRTELRPSGGAARLPWTGMDMASNRNALMSHALSAL